MKEHRRNLSQRLEKWLQTRREIILPVPISTAQLRLKIAFASIISTSRGFLFADYKYTGEVNDTELNIQFTVHGRGIAHYSMNGKLFPDPKGTRLEMIVKDEGPIQFVPIVATLIFFIVLTRNIISTFFAFLFMWFAFAGLRWHRNSAADAVSGLIRNIVSQ